MKSITFYLDELKNLTGSDYKSAIELNMDRATLSGIRKKGQLADETAIKLARALKRDEAELLLAAAFARSKGDTKNAWEKFARIAGYSACFTLSFQSITYVIDSIMYIMLNRYRVRFS